MIGWRAVVGCLLLSSLCGCGGRSRDDTLRGPGEFDDSPNIERCQSPDPILLDSDAAVAALATRACDTVASLEITGAVSTLAGLQTIARVTGRIYVHDTSGLATLKGLDGVESTGLVVVGTPNLASLDGLEGTRQVTRMILDSNLALSDLSALSNASFVGAQVTITGGQAMASLAGLGGMTEVDTLTLAANPGLEDVNGLANLRSVQNLAITGNSRLVDVDLPNLESAESLTIAGNLTLTALNLTSLENVHSATISANPLLLQCVVDEVAQVASECDCEGNGGACER